MNLCLIYHFQSSHNVGENFKPASYKAVSFFNEQGFLEKTFQQEMAKSIPEADFMNLYFLNLDDLKAFALRVAAELESEEVRMISVQDFNIGLDAAKDLATLKSGLTKYGEIVAPQEGARKKGFFGLFK